MNIGANVMGESKVNCKKGAEKGMAWPVQEEIEAKMLDIKNFL